MNDIKGTISLFCKGLKQFCGVDIKTEHIRRAKFNEVSDENVAALWLVLYKLCDKLIHKGIESDSVESDEARVIFVKFCFAAWKYERVEFYKLPANNKCGSQELLISLAWLLAKQQFFDKLVIYQIWLFKQEMRKYKNNEIISSFNKESSRNMKFEDDLNNILQLCGKLKYNLNRIIQLNLEHINLVHKIHKETGAINGVPHLFFDEARLFLEGNDEILKSVTELQSMIKVHRKWKEKSCVFWRWMDTVLDEASLHSSAFENDGNYQHFIGFLQVLITRLNSKLKSPDRHALSSSSKVNAVPNLILSPDDNEKNPSELKFIQEIVCAELISHEKLIKEMEIGLYRQIKTIADDKLGSLLFIIPQLYSK